MSYEVNLNGITQGNDVTRLFAVAVNDADLTMLEFDGPSTWPGVGSTPMAHIFPFDPTQMVVFGVTDAIVGGPLGTDKDHIVLGASNAFVGRAAGLKWSQNFPGPGDPPVSADRVRHSTFVQLVKDYAADSSNTTALNILKDFISGELMPEAGFDPEEAFRVIRFTSGVTAGTVYDDANGNGIVNAGEGIAGATITLTLSGSCAGQTTTATTDANGEYNIKATDTPVSGVPGCSGDITVSNLPDGCIPETRTEAINDLADEDIITNDFSFNCYDTPKCHGWFAWICHFLWYFFHHYH